MFHVYQLRGRYPNRDYPSVFQDSKVGEQAKTLFDDAQEILKEIVATGSVKPSAVFGIHRASKHPDCVDDILITRHEDGKPYILRGLRQQSEETIEATNTLCISDFMADAGTEDYICTFFCQCGWGVDSLKKAATEAGEIDRAILLEAVADRLVEAYAELLHKKIRTEYWGFSANENLGLADLLKVKYRGIRPAPGYPSQPDHREKGVLWDLLDVDRLTQGELSLTSSFMTLPSSSVCALVFANPESRYFTVGTITQDQVADYAKRTNSTIKETERWLGSFSIGYMTN